MVVKPDPATPSIQRIRRHIVPVGFKPQADAIVGKAGLNFNLLFRIIAGHGHGIAVQQAEYRQAIAQRHPMIEVPSLIEREGQVVRALAQAGQPTDRLPRSAYGFQPVYTQAQFLALECVTFTGRGLKRVRLPTEARIK